jgi:L-ascorbate metabolism protein UlaG (beta-lactamase superfamily)
MKEIGAKVYYIYHSGFVIKTKNHFLVFDYYKDPIESYVTNRNLNVLSPENIKAMENMFVFSSHSHADHFNSEILNWQAYNGNIRYILSKDIKLDESKENYTFIEQNQEKSLEDVYVKAYGSTDIGISFLVKVDGLTIFHAGDLNWWHWKEDSNDEQLVAEKSFKAHIEKLKEEKSIDIAFFPVDPRLEEFYYIGGEYFAKEIQPKLLIPMHFGDNTYITKEFAHTMKKININAIEINNAGEEIIF